MVLLQGLMDRPATWTWFSRWFSEPTAERALTQDCNLNLHTGIDEVVVVAAGASGNSAKTHHGTRLERGDETQPREHVFGFVADDYRTVKCFVERNPLRAKIGRTKSGLGVIQPEADTSQCSGRFTVRRPDCKAFTMDSSREKRAE